MKKPKSHPYVVIVDNEIVARFNGLIEYNVIQRESVAKEYADRLSLPESAVRVYPARHFPDLRESVT